MRNLTISILAVAAIPFLASCAPAPPPADMVLLDGEVYTMEAEHPWAEAVVVTGNEITAVLDSSDEA